MNEPSKSGRKLQRRAILVLATLATLVALFYLEEDWRGKRAWMQCKAELEAAGVEMDWNKCVPPAVPDDQNFFMASNILPRFKRYQSDGEYKMATNASNMSWLLINYESKSFPTFITTKTNPLLVANLIISPAAVPRLNSDADLLVKFSDPDAAGRVQGAIQKKLGRSIEGAAGFKFSELQLSNLAPARIVLDAETPSIADLSNLIPKNLVTNLGQLQIAAAGDGRFQVLLTDSKVTTAAAYLQWSDQYAPALDEVRDALKRPYAILPGDYSRPYEIPIPNFVIMRSIAQMLAQRAQCDLLLNQPAKALPEILLMHDLCRILERPPTGRPITLVESMINVAISGLYAATVADGFRLHVWQEPQLIALQKQLQTFHVAPLVRNSLQSEIVATATTLQISTPAELAKLFGPARNLSDKVTAGYWLLYIVPRGWYYQNMVVAAKLTQNIFPAFDLPNDLIHPALAEKANAEAKMEIDEHWSLWSRWAARSTPNFTKATQVTAYNQTLVNEAQIDCALERYHQKHGEYPDTLDALIPEYIEKLPHDIIGGQPLHYRRTNAGKFILYSIGWNEKDDGGTVALTKAGAEDRENGDWVWRN